ncbi:transcriptional-regulating factor 1-like isoform X1 [Astyanax mexicanus]|uniref:Transcriptional-regulating factor 1-like isoform X1 n=1 Tax=Astyanax mexicanus TaxID=7994 RepID=A0A8T2LXR7_ASTMX|nr:transcriptional-regulating factor 1-like isoform X1 [Astyanax mexicanus]
MADHTSIHPPDSLPFPAMYRFQPQGPRSSHGLYQSNSMTRLSHYGDTSNLLCEPAGSCATPGTSMNGVEDEINSAYWDMESSVSSQSLLVHRFKAHSGVYEEEWNSNSQQHATLDDYSGTGGNHQKLDSFSDAFSSRSICRNNSIAAGKHGGYNGAPNNSPPPLPTLSFPLVLSPPPTPLPPSSLSPSKRAPHPPAAQILNQVQVQLQSHSPSEGSMRFFPPHSCTGSTLPGSFSPAHWMTLCTDVGESGDITQHLHQDPSPSSIYPDGVGLHPRHLNATQRDADCSLENSPCSPLAHHPQSQSVLKLEHDPVTSEDHITWSQSQPFCPPVHPSHTQIEGLRVDEDTKHSSVLQRTNFLCLPTSQNSASAIYTGLPFQSVLQSGVLRENYWYSTHYTPPPMLNPCRSGTGLFCNLLPPLDNRGLWSRETEPSGQERCVNIGPEFQAELPDLLERGEYEDWLEEPLQEELLWKPWAELEESNVIQEHVENLLDLSTSTALPGGGANLELALHSLSLCRGNILAALDMMFFSNSSPSRDYHYAGSDVWRSSEQKLFHKAFTLYGKDFSFIQKMVKSKRISQCVEFYYHCKRLQEKQRKLKEREKEQQQQQMDSGTNFNSANQVMMPAKIMMNSINMDRLIHTPSLATSFPCKQCGKMFYKIKSRNAHMKIHRQQQEDWRERIHSNNHNMTQTMQNQSRTLAHTNQLVTQSHQNQLLTQSLIQNLVQSQAQLAFLQNAKTQNSCFTPPISSMGPSQSPQVAPKAPALPLYPGNQQTWGALHGNLESSLYYN